MSQKKEPRYFSGRINLISGAVFLAAFFIVFRLFSLQIVEGEYYYELSRRQQSFAEDVFLPSRGEIYLREHDGSLFTLATTRSGYDLYIEPKNLEDSAEAFRGVSSVLGIDEDDFFKAAAKEGDPFELIKNNITLEEGKLISALGIKGVGLLDSKKRHYPGGTLASHVLGFVSTLADDARGKYGIESYYENVLSAAPAFAKNPEEESGFLFILGEQFSRGTPEAENIVLTFEPETQLFAERKLKELYEKWDYRSGGIVVIKPKTGEIKAMAAYPDFDPNKYYEADSLEVFLNPFAQKVYEMGSVFKPLTMAAAINEGAVTPESTYVDEGFVKIGPNTIHNFDGEARGLSSMTKVLAESLNTGAVFAMRQVGGVKLKEYFYKFGLGEKLGVDLPGEVAGNLKNLDSGREIEFATASFGQGVAVTPLGLASALGVLANGGVLMRPYVAERHGPRELRRVIKEETALKISRMLVEVVDTTLAGGTVKMPGYSIAAKTGTAQMPNKNSAGYSDEFLHSYFGYFPAYEPEFLIFMFLENPKGVRYASQSLSDTFKDTVEFLINYYTILPDR